MSHKVSSYYETGNAYQFKRPSRIPKYNPNDRVCSDNHTIYYEPAAYTVSTNSYGLEVCWLADGTFFIPGYRAAARFISQGLEKPIDNKQVQNAIQGAKNT